MSECWRQQPPQERDNLYTALVQSVVHSLQLELSAPVECLNYEEPAGDRWGEWGEWGEWRQQSYHLYRQQQDPSLAAFLLSPVTSKILSQHCWMFSSRRSHIHDKVIRWGKTDNFLPEWAQKVRLSVDQRAARHCDPVWSIIIAQQAQVTAGQDQTKEQLFHDFYH